MNRAAYALMRPPPGDLLCMRSDVVRGCMTARATARWRARSFIPRPPAICPRGSGWTSGLLCELPEKKGYYRPIPEVSQCAQPVEWRVRRVSTQDRALGDHVYRECIS